MKETKCSGEELSSIARKVWKGCESIALDARGAAGSLGILWNPQEVHLSGFLASPYMLLDDFHIIGTIIRGVISNVYGPPRAE